MGTEAYAACYRNGATSQVRLHLDSKELTIRADAATKIARASISDIRLEDEGLSFLTNGERILLTFSQKEAQRWQKALLKTPPTLAEKLGLIGDAKAYVLGKTDDEPLNAALAGQRARSIEQASMLLAIVETRDDLDAALTLAAQHPSLHIWMVCKKGKKAIIGDTVIRAAARERGFMDNKTSAVSDLLSATRYRWK